MEMKLNATSLLWAKTRGEPPYYHPLLFHLLDVAACAAALWDDGLPEVTRRSVAAGLGLTKADARRWVIALAGTHDLGKASPAFQYLNVREKGAHPAIHDLQRQLTVLGCTVDGKNGTRHGPISALLLAPLLERHGTNRTTARTLAVAVGGHHGVFPRAVFQKNGVVEAGSGQTPAWQAMHTALEEIFIAAIGGVPNVPPTLCDNTTAMTIAGLVSVADWLGSDTGTADEPGFTFALPPAPDAEAYFKEQQTTARVMLTRHGWLAPTVLPARQWNDMFAFPPRPLQTLIADEVAPLLNEPGLLVVETPMGSGKTEAALYAAEHAAVQCDLGGYYIALPTQATSNQMFHRVRQYLDTRYGDAGSTANAMLLHGHADLSEEFAQLRQAANLYLPTLAPIAEDEGDETEHTSHTDRTAGDPTTIASAWFMGRRRGLLAPFAIGTVDQGLLAVLQTRHFFVRLFGLGQKVIVIDEVHAYDTYMTTLLERLLQWLAALGCTVILLSATLPRERREKLFRAYADGRGLPKDAALPAHALYPRISALIGGVPFARTVPLAKGARSQPITLVHLSAPLVTVDGRADALVAELHTRLTAGGCAAVICNTVRRAQAVYRALAVAFPDEVDLLHARYRFIERDVREKRSLLRFGAPGSTVDIEENGQPITQKVKRPHRAILVATQIIEQSLDLDFDLMVSELAPADLVLQRTGRLHRHKRGARRTRVSRYICTIFPARRSRYLRGARPAPVWKPVLLLAPPETMGEGGVPGFGGSGFVYAPHVLLRSWLELRQRTTITVPDDIEPMIEAVYDDARSCSDPTLQTVWDATREKLDKQQRKYRKLAKQNAFPPPSYDDDIFEVLNKQLQEDTPEVNPTLQALTRLTDPSISVVVLRADVECDERYLNVPHPTLADARELIRRSVQISHRSIAPWFIAQESPSQWKKSSLLRHSRLVVLAADGKYVVSGGAFTIRYDMNIGIEIVQLTQEVN